MTPVLEEAYATSKGAEKIYLAGELAKRTQDKTYTGFLDDQLKAATHGSGWSAERKQALIGLAKAAPEIAEPIIVKVMVDPEDSLGREVACKALLESKQPGAAKLLHDSGITIIGKGHFPRAQLETLIALNTAEADDYYSKLKAVSMNPKRGFAENRFWMSSDFDSLEGMKKTRPGRVAK